MIIKRYVVNSMNEAMTRIRYELGAEAVIISQRKIRKPGIKGLFTSKIIEVTAAVENQTNDNDLNALKKNETKSDGQSDNGLRSNGISSIEALKKVVQQENTIKVYPKEIQTKKKETNEDSLQELQKNEKNDYNISSNIMSEMMKMQRMISELSLTKESSDNGKGEVEKILEENDVDQEIIESILEKMKDDDNEYNNSQDENLKENEIKRLKDVLKGMIHVSSLKLQGRIVLVGPTGVGKTTTIAKLAGRLALTQGKKVGLITVDTYRIGAVEQLKTYADIMNIPFEVVYSVNDMEKALESMSECEVVLIDTTGRSSKNRMQISELRTFVEKVGTKNVSLVLSATTKNKDIKYIIEGYQVLNYNSIIVTKLDETSTYGSILNILESAKVPLSFVSTGQNVPDDIKELSTDNVVSLVLGEDAVC